MPYLNNIVMPFYYNLQGLVYIKCASNADAGKIFESINANYFDSKCIVSTCQLLGSVLR